MKAYRQLSNFRGDSAFPTWLARIASHHCIDVLRGRARHPVESLDDVSSEAFGDSFADTSPSPAETMLSAETLQTALAVLPEDGRTIVLLREMEGLTYEEIAETLKCTVDAVKARLQRARALFLKKVRSL